MLFAHLARRRHPDDGAEPSRPGDCASQKVPRGFEALADALLSGVDAESAATEVGRDMASDGMSVDEVLTDLEATYTAVGADGPDYHVARGLFSAWTEVSLRYLHDLSCADPLTGLASLPHLRSRLDEVYREADQRGARVCAEWALVVVEVSRPARRAGDGPRGRPPVEESNARRFGPALRMAEAADALRAVFSGGETLARAGVHRVVALVRRRSELAAQAESVRQLLASRSVPVGADGQRRVWIEGLPSSSDSASVLLDELAR